MVAQGDKKYTRNAESFVNLPGTTWVGFEAIG